MERWRVFQSGVPSYRRSRKSEKHTAESEWNEQTVSYTSSESVSRSLRRRRRKRAMPPLCIHMYRPWWKGWQLISATGMPGYAARTCAKSRPDSTFWQSLVRFGFDQAGEMEVKVHGVMSLLLGQVYHPMPNPSALRLPGSPMLCTRSFALWLCTSIECFGFVIRSEASSGVPR